MSSWAVPGIPIGLTSAATAMEVVFLVGVCLVGDGVMKAEADTNVVKISADESFIMYLFICARRNSVHGLPLC